MNRSEFKTSSICSTGCCVGVAIKDEAVYVTNTTTPDSPITRFTHEEWKAFLAAVQIRCMFLWATIL